LGRELMRSGSYETRKRKIGDEVQESLPQATRKETNFDHRKIEKNTLILLDLRPGKGTAYIRGKKTGYSDLKGASN